MATKRTSGKSGTSSKRGSAAKQRAKAAAGSKSRAAAKPKTTATSAARGRTSGASRTTETRTTSPKSRGAKTTTAAKRRGSRPATPRRGEEGLSRSTLRAKWLNSPEEHADRPGQSLATRNHEVIQRWAEQRGAKPATVEGSWYGDRPGVLRFDFPGYGGRQLEPVDWNDWFRTFDERKLVFLFQEQKRDGSDSNFFRFDNPEREDA